MNIVPSGEQTQSPAFGTQCTETLAQHGLPKLGPQPFLNPNAQTFMPGGVAPMQPQQPSSRQHIAHGGLQPTSDGHRQQGRMHGRGDGGEGGLSRAFQGRHSSTRSDRSAEHGRGRHGRSHDSSNSRGSSHPQEGFHGSDQSSAVSNQAPEVVLGGPEQSPLGRSPSNRTYSSANHLLNFQYDSYAQYGRGGRGSNEGRGRGGYRRPAPKPMPYNRNKFLQANFRFLVSDAGNLRRHEADADLMLDWDDVVQVVMMTGGEVQCPISLETDPLCPQITPCGHVFAFHSIMQHLMTQGGEDLRKAARCPLCYSMVAARELKLVQVHRIHIPQVNDTVTFKLLQRPRDSIIPKEVPPQPHACSHSTSKKEEEHTDDSNLSASTWGSGRNQKDTIAATAHTAAASTAGTASKSCTADNRVKKKDSKSNDGKSTDGKGTDTKSNGRNRHKGHIQNTAEAQQEDGRGFNKYAKFTTVADGNAFWKAAAEELAHYAAQLTAEGGWDAAQEAPFLYAAIDALAARAGTWAERQQRLRIESASKQAASEMAEPVVISRQAIAFVKQFSTAAVHAAEEQREAASKEAHRQALFPSLSSSSAPIKPAATNASGSATPRPRLTPLVRLQGKGASSPAPAPAAAATNIFEPAFSDDEDEGKEPDQAAVATAEPLAQTQSEEPRQESRAEQASDNLMGTSPVGAAGVSHLPSAEFYFYQSADGQCVFLHPLVSRALLAHFGSYAACPPEVVGRVLEIEDLVQTDVTRKRMKHIAHLPLSGAFKLAEIDLAPLLPSEALAPFAEEISGRQRRRDRKAEQDARTAHREAAAAADAAAAAASKGLTARELKAMPKPSNLAAAQAASMNEEDALDAAIAQSLGITGSPDHDQDVHGAGPDGAAPPPEAGVSFANIAQMGFAATGPRLSPGAPKTGNTSTHQGSPGVNSKGAAAWGPQLPGTKSSPAGAPQGNPASAWGSSKGSTLASQLVAAETHAAAAAQDAAKEKSKGKRMVLLSTTQRRYT